MSDATPCRIVPGISRTVRGYGKSRVRRFGVIVNFRHRLAWIDAHGCLPPDDRPFILHRCDVPACEEPAHLFAGSQLDNMRDMAAKGRRAPLPDNQGERNGAHVLTADDVRAIRVAAANDHTMTALARRYGVSRAQISRIVRRHRWRHVL